MTAKILYNLVLTHFRGYESLFIILKILVNSCPVALHQAQKTGKSVPGGHVFRLTRYENRPKVRLVMNVKNCKFHQTPHSQHFIKLPFGQPKAPGAKNG